MASLYFYYSAMNAGKTTTLLQAAYNYRERGMKPLLLAPRLDNRFADTSEQAWIASRIGLQSPATAFEPDSDLFALVQTAHIKETLACILIDEAQFLSREQVWQLSDVVDQLGIAVLCYGLRTDAFGEPFPGSQTLLAIADHLLEIKTVCHCGRKATMVLRIDEQGLPVRAGDQVAIGGNDRYVSLCRRHYKASLQEGELV
ncbi:thymidine kinase [Pokkaliibacter plantistimulans]|uniref:Thymidine kinase n=1 Tax=Proteobacteria bacterium 228 TaxID=2083153 RepID=A0A2S5KT63_9PROT|nr:thymidine kinase [Pokkaliibacter plantistimulans]PPC77719.1 thymidine kinase [Pokkaliibacter plantistimulans]